MQDYWLSIERRKMMVLFSDPVSESILGLYLVPIDELAAFRHYSWRTKTLNVLSKASIKLGLEKVKIK